MTLTSSLDILIPRWRSQGTDMLPPSTPSTVIETFRRVGQEPSVETMTLYQSLGGMRMMDNLLWRLWPLDEIEQLNQEPSEYGVLFSDFLIDSHVYRLRQVDHEVSDVWVDAFDLGPPMLVAPSLTDFFATYCTRPSLVLDPPSR